MGNGIDDALDRIDDLKSNMKDIEGEQSVALSELLTDAFMQQYTEFYSEDEMFEASPWTVESESDFEAIPDDEFDQFIAEYTQFESWSAMQKTAHTEWTKRNLGL